MDEPASGSAGRRVAVDEQVHHHQVEPFAEHMKVKGGIGLDDAQLCVRNDTEMAGGQVDHHRVDLDHCDAGGHAQFPAKDGDHAPPAKPEQQH